MKTLLNTVFLLFSVACFAQSIDNENYIIEFLGQDQYNVLQQENPAYLEFLDTRCSYGFKVIDYEDEKMNSFSVLNEIRVITGGDKSQKVVVTAQDLVADFNDGNFNFLKYQFQFDKSELTYYVLGTTGKVIMIYPVDYLSKLVQKN